MNSQNIIDQRFKEARFLNVSALNRYINYKFEVDDHLQEVYLQGEISNFKKSGRHYYFSLKDEFSEISAMMFYPDTLNLKFIPQDGSLVQVMGKVQVYLKRGTYAIVVKIMAEQGIGILYQQFLDLKEKLSKEGLFDVTHKLPLPEYPKNIAIITAATGDAVHDIISTFNRRLSFAKLTLYPTLVQGKDAPQDLMRALRAVYQQGTHDALIIGRGGGSFEDLSCFNDEQLARLLFASPIPTVSAIGHESDYTICDFVSSFRAPTPTGAAVQLSKERSEVINQIDHLTKRLNNAQKANINNRYLKWRRLATSYLLVNFHDYLNNFSKNISNIQLRLTNASPLRQIDVQLNRLDNLNKRMKQTIFHIIHKAEINLQNTTTSLRKELITDRTTNFDQKLINFIKRLNQILEQRIELSDQKINNLTDKIVILNPFNVMKKGYSIIYQEGNVKSKISQINQDKSIDIQMIDGTIKAKIINLNIKGVS